MKTLIRKNANIPWLIKPNEGRHYITDETPPEMQCGSAFGLVFEGENFLMAHILRRGWDIPGGMIDYGETSAEAAVREVWEEAYAHVEIIELIGIQELEVFCPRPLGYRWPYPISVQVYYLCRLIDLAPFKMNMESYERKFFTPDEVRALPTMANHDLIYEEALRRVRVGK